MEPVATAAAEATQLAWISGKEILVFGILPIVAALAGAFLGAIVGARQTLKVELKLREEERERQEKALRLALAAEAAEIRDWLEWRADVVPEDPVKREESFAFWRGTLNTSDLRLYCIENLHTPPEPCIYRASLGCLALLGPDRLRRTYDLYRRTQLFGERAKEFIETLEGRPARPILRTPSDPYHEFLEAWPVLLADWQAAIDDLQPRG